MTPPRHTPLESSRHLTGKTMAKLGSRPARCMHIEATPSGQGRVVRAHFLRYCVARLSSASVAGAQGRGPVESITPCYAIQSFHDCLLGESGDHVGQGQPLCKWVSSSALSRVSEPRPPKRPPTRRLLLPRTGLAHGSMVRMARLTLPVTSGSGKRDAAASRDGPPPRLRRSVLALRPSWSLPPSFHGPVPPPSSWSLSMRHRGSRSSRQFRPKFRQHLTDPSLHNLMYRACVPASPIDLATCATV